MMRHIVSTVLLLLLMIAGGQCRKNVLFLLSDDLRPQLNAWEGSEFPESVSPPMITPNLDALAARSLMFARAYSQYARCNPSRMSFMTGRRPDTTKVYNLLDNWRDVGGNFTSIPQYFKDNGYLSIGIGKIYHPNNNTQDPMSWSEKLYRPPNYNWHWKNASWVAVTPEDEVTLPDVFQTNYAIETLDRIAPAALSGEQPFFLAVGFQKPHLPFSCPNRFFDLYPRDSVNFPAFPYMTENIPDIAAVLSPELTEYQDIKDSNFTLAFNETLDSDLTLDLRRAYYACVSYVDALIGDIISKVEDLGLSNNTVISFASDHGFNLGENSRWGKKTNYELATHSPMMIHVPGVTDRGIRTNTFAELVDLFPTVTDAAGLEVPPLCPEDSSDIMVCTEGWSLMPLATNSSSGKPAAFSQAFNNIDENTFGGYSVRTDQYHYTEWIKVNVTDDFPPEYIMDWEDNYGYELYDHTLDPEEHYNCVDDETYESERLELSALLRAGWRSVYPG